MKNYEKITQQFEKQIKYISSKYDMTIREDLEQDLYLFLINLTKKLSNYNINNYKDYIFISLKNKANDIYKKSYKKDVSIYSLNITIKEAYIIKKYYIENMTQQEIAKELCTSQQYISKVKNIGLKKLKTYFETKRDNFM